MMRFRPAKTASRCSIRTRPIPRAPAGVSVSGTPLTRRRPNERLAAGDRRARLSDRAFGTGRQYRRHKGRSQIRGIFQRIGRVGGAGSRQGVTGPLRRRATIGRFDQPMGVSRWVRAEKARSGKIAGGATRNRARPPGKTRQPSLKAVSGRGDPSHGPRPVRRADQMQRVRTNRIGRMGPALPVRARYRLPPQARARVEGLSQRIRLDAAAGPENRLRHVRDRIVRTGANVMMYRGYEFEQKPLMVGWQVVIRKEDAFVRNCSVCSTLDPALEEARGFVDALMAAGTSGMLPAAS